MSTTVKRLQYDTEGEETVLGLPATEITETHDGSVQSGNAALQIDDAFDIDDLSLSGVGGTGLVALAAKIAEVQAQERLIPSGITGSLVVPGFTMQDTDTLSLVADGETDPTYNDDEVTVDPLTDDEIEETTGMTASALAKGLSATAVTLYPMQTTVSYAGTLSGVTVLCDRRKSMAGYTVDGATEVAWVPVPKTWWDGLAADVQTALLTALGIDGVVKSMSALQSVEVDEDGVIDLDGEVEDLDNNSRVFFSANGTTERQFADVSVDGDMQMYWYNPSYLIGILAAVPRVSMQSVLGLAAVCVGINGGVPSWVIAILKQFPNADVSALAKVYANGGKYITDGLCFMLDMTSATADTWKDIVGLNEFTSNGAVTLDSNGVPTFNGSAKYTNSNTLGFSYGSCSLEIVCKLDSTQDFTEIFYSKNEVCMRLKSDSYSDCRMNYGDKGSVFAFGSNTSAGMGSFVTISVNTAVGFYKNKANAQTSGSIGGKGTYTGSAVGLYAIGKIYSIRIYNRLLTADEMIANQTIDLARFSNI